MSRSSFVQISFPSKIFENHRETNEAITLREAIGKHTCSIFALESMLYLTTGILDEYDNSNIDLETAIFKVSASLSPVQIKFPLNSNMFFGLVKTLCEMSSFICVISTDIFRGKIDEHDRRSFKFC